MSKHHIKVATFCKYVKNHHETLKKIILQSVFTNLTIICSIYFFCAVANLPQGMVGHLASYRLKEINCTFFFLLHAAKVPFILQRRSRAERPTVSIS